MVYHHDRQARWSAETGFELVTIKDIARDTGLSSSTVARALGGGGPVGSDTRQRVYEAADRLGYVVSSAARSMRNQSSNMVGLIVPDIVNRFYSEMARAIAAACDARGFHFLLSVTDDDPERELRQMRAMVAARAAAVALVPGPRSHPSIAQLAARQPFAQLVRRSDQIQSDWFGFDEQTGLEAATAHLIELGHRNILLVCGQDRYSTGRARQMGYANALKKAGLDVDERLVRAGEPTVMHGQAAMADIPSQVSAVIAAGTLLTEGAVDAINTHRWSVPEEMSFVGFGIEKWLRWWRGGMTRIVPPVEVLAETCAAQLLSRIGCDERDRPPGSNFVTHAPQLLIGSTTQRIV